MTPRPIPVSPSAALGRRFAEHAEALAGEDAEAARVETWRGWAAQALRGELTPAPRTEGAADG